jgi:hypothetical protein
LIFLSLGLDNFRSNTFFPATLTLMGLAPASSYAATRTVSCSNAACLTSALSDSQAGDTIILASGTYTGNFVAPNNGASANPVVIQSASTTSKAILNGGGTSSGYALYITGDYVHVKDLKITNAKKGIMLDNANNGLIDGTEVYNIGEEGVHYRDGSSNNTIQNSNVHNTGTVTPYYGEGVYVGSDVGKWGTFNAATNNNKISNVTIGPNVRAESVDIKEGTSGTIVENSSFNGTGISGANYSDSFMDVKGNDSIIRGNTVSRNGNSVIVDGGSAKVCDNTRSPSGNMYTGSVTTYTSCTDGGGTGPSELSITSITDSGNDGNVPQNTSDNNLGTRWSSQGDGQWIQYDLGASKTVANLSVAFHQGDVRTTTFDIQISSNGTTWTTVLSSKVSTVTLSQVSYDFTDTAGRYVRIVGHGNSTGNGWNSITEVDIFGS